MTPQPMGALSIFGVPMNRLGVTYAPDYWEHQTGDLRLIVCTAVNKPNGYWWAIETFDGSATICSSYRSTPRAGREGDRRVARECSASRHGTSGAGARFGCGEGIPMKVLIEGAAIFKDAEGEPIPTDEVQVTVLGEENESVPSGCVHLVFPDVTVEFGVGELSRALRPFLKGPFDD